jgi:uncharacterized protein (UPF0147 family)
LIYQEEKKNKDDSMNNPSKTWQFSKDNQPDRTKIKKAAITREFRKRLLKDLFGVKHLDFIAYKKFISMLKEVFYDPNTPLIERAKLALTVIDKLAPKLSAELESHEDKPYVKDN